MMKADKLFITVACVVMAGIGMFIGIGFFVCMALMYIFRGHYTSLWSVLFFLIGSFLVGLVCDFLFHLCMDVAATIQPPGFLAMLIIVDLFVSWLPLYAVDEWMTSVTVPLTAELCGALILCLLSLPDLQQRAQVANE